MVIEHDGAGVLTGRVTAHGEQLANYGARIVSMEAEVESLRKDRERINHEIERHIMQLAALKERVDDVEDEAARHGELLVRADLPEMRRELAAMSTWQQTETVLRSTAKEGVSRVWAVALAIVGTIGSTFVIWLVLVLSRLSR